MDDAERFHTRGIYDNVHYHFNCIIRRKRLPSEMPRSSANIVRHRNSAGDIGSIAVAISQNCYGDACGSTFIKTR